MKVKFAILLIALGTISFFIYPRKHETYKAPISIPTEEQTTKALHESKRFIVKYSNNFDQQLMSQFDSNNTAINFATSHIFTEGFSLHYLYDRETKQHLAGDSIYNKQDDIFCTQLDVVASMK